MATTLSDILKLGKDEGKELDVTSVCFTLGYIAGAAARVSRAQKPLRIGGVPEHFNLPVQLGIERNLFDLEPQPEFVVQKCGTGAMIAALKAKEVDVIIALTEGIVADIAKNHSDVRILGVYVDSPLCWAISAAGQGTVQSVDDLRGKTWAVSRMGSGSHLMASVLGAQRGWSADEVKFKVVGKFADLRASVNSADTAAFMWEHFTTKPFHDSGEVRRVGEIRTPWPCFMLATTAATAASRKDELGRLMAGLVLMAKKFHATPDTTPGLVAERCKLQLADAREWYEGVRIAGAGKVDGEDLLRAQAALVGAGVLTPAQGNLTAKDFMVSL